jgi:hypothetical protein
MLGEGARGAGYLHIVNPRPGMSQRRHPRDYMSTQLDGRAMIEGCPPLHSTPIDYCPKTQLPNCHPIVKKTGQQPSRKMDREFYNLELLQMTLSQFINCHPERS